MKPELSLVFISSESKYPFQRMSELHLCPTPLLDFIRKWLEEDEPGKMIDTLINRELLTRKEKGEVAPPYV